MDKVPVPRKIFHDNIDNAQKTILHLTSKKDSVFKASKDDDVNRQISQIVKFRVDNMQCLVESDSTISTNDKYKWLRGINDMLTDFINGYQYSTIKGVLLGDLVIAYNNCMQLELKKKSIQPIVEKAPLEIGNILVKNFALKENPGVAASKNVLVLKLCKRYPDNILRILSQNLDVPFADSLIIVFAYRNPEHLYDYAAASNPLGEKIRSVNDPLVKTISRMSRMSSGRFFFPFLDNIYHNKISLDSLEKIIDNEEAYYKLLVATEIDYTGRLHNGDTPMVKHVLTEKLKAKALEIYVTEINALHDIANENIRFKKLENLTAEELYYLAVLGEEEIYTSSFVNGVYPRMMKRMKSAKSDSLLVALNYDFYKKFIKMCSSYNTLDDFLKRMDKNVATQLMKSFVDGLEKNNSLEDAVDVADSYSSINDLALRKLILDEVQVNLQKSQQEHNKNGEIVYDLLNNIFLSINPDNKIDLAAKYSIPPVFVMPNQLLKDTATGRINILQFFYGDKDGRDNFAMFVNSFSNGNWKIIRRTEWVEVRSTKGTPVSIYTNRPFDEKDNTDTKAQEALRDYLDSLGVEPTVVIHRGHSYWAKSTINQLPYSAKVILLGSCGGYQSLDKILGICPYAQIISSKQTGTGKVNSTLIDAITEKLRQGKDLNWPDMWKNIQVKLGAESKEKFDDYVPPHKNLGAIFIMAYNKQMEKED